MLIDIKENYGSEIQLLTNIFEWISDRKIFITKVNNLQEDALMAYTVLLAYKCSKSENENTNDLLFNYEDIFEIINNNLELLCQQTKLRNYMLDIFGLTYSLSKCDANHEFQEKCDKYFMEALASQNENAIDMCLQVGACFNAITKTGFTINVEKSIVDILHGKVTNEKLFAKTLLLIEANVKKGQDSQKLLSIHCLESIWSTLCKHQCDRCYTTIAHLITFYIHECHNDLQFSRNFLNDSLWLFIRNGIESSELLRRKQSIYILKNVLEFATNHELFNNFAHKNFMVNNQINSLDEIRNTWKTYFIVLENLVDIQSHLILSSLEQYLCDIVKYLPDFWYSAIFVIVLKHHNSQVIQYGIEFILNGQQHFERTDLQAIFYMALNNVFLYAKDKTFPADSLVDYIGKKLSSELDLLSKIEWKAVPAWILLKSIDSYLSNEAKKNECEVIKFIVPKLFVFIGACIKVCKSQEVLNVNKFIVNIIQSIGFEYFTLEQLLILYDKTHCDEIISGIQNPLTIEIYEKNFIQLRDVTRETKVKYFIYARLPNGMEKIKFLDDFYATNEWRMNEFPDYEFLLFHCLYLTESLYSALQIFKPRLYNLSTKNSEMTVDTLLFAVTVLQFIVNGYLDIKNGENDENGNRMFCILTMIKDVSNNFQEAYRSKLYLGKDVIKETLISNRITAIIAKLAMCAELYPNRMVVLAILSDAILFDEYELDLHRFNEKDTNDFNMIQSLFDWFMAESDFIKSSKRAKTIAKFLTSFPALECDVHEVFSILLSGKCDVKCIFNLTHLSSRNDMNHLLIEALLYGNELKGDERLQYEFSISVSERSATYNQKVRLAAMNAIAHLQTTKDIIELKNLLFAKNNDIYRARYFNHSYQHSMKLRYIQALAFLFRLEPVWDKRLLHFLLNEANQNNVMYITEMIIAETVEPKQLIHVIENIEGNRGLPSMFTIMYYVCCKKSNVDVAIECIELLLKYIFLRQITVRSAAQIVLLKLCEHFEVTTSYQSICDGIKASVSTNPCVKLLKWSYTSDVRLMHINCQHLLHSVYILREIPRLTNMCSDEYYANEIYDKTDNGLTISQNVKTVEPTDTKYNEISFSQNFEDSSTSNGSGNVQKKMVSFRETFIDRQLLNTLPKCFQIDKKNSNLIVLASLVSKIPNLGGICRSSEVFGVKAIAVDNLQILSRMEFTSVSMGSEKWLDMIEIKSHYLVGYLLAMKSKGYCVVGAEQTASGQLLNKTTLPHKMILILGQEKDGIPANLINLLDMAIEIPQFGVIRSLNVHVTAALFMWEYCKQHMLETADVSR